MLFIIIITYSISVSTGFKEFLKRFKTNFDLYLREQSDCWGKLVIILLHLSIAIYNSSGSRIVLETKIRTQW